MEAPGTATAPSPREARLGLLLGFGAYACWGLLSPVGKHLLEAMPPLWLNAVRFTIAAAVLLPALGRRAALGSLRALRHPTFLGANLLANVSLTLFLYSLTRLEATEATLLFYSAPLWTAAWAHVRLGERMGPWFPPAAVGLMVGGYVALFGLSLPGRVDTVGVVLGLLSGVLWAFYTVALRQVDAGLGIREMIGSAFVMGALYFGSLALLFEPWPGLSGFDGRLGWLALYVAVPSLGSFVLFMAAVRLAPAGQINVLVAAELAFTALFAWLLFGDRFTWVQVGGLALALASVSGYLYVHTRSLGSSPPVPEASSPPVG